MTLLVECWWDSAPELMTPDLSGAFSGITTNPMLMLEACQARALDGPRCGRSGTGWDLYLSCVARSAGYLQTRRISIPFCAQLDPRAAFDTESMLRQAAEIGERIPGATIKVPMTMAGIEVIKLLVPTGATINATWGFSVAQLVAAAKAIKDGYRDVGSGGHSGPIPPRRHVLTLMEGRIGDLGLRSHLGHDTKIVRAAECVVFESAYHALRRYEDVATLLASSLRPGPGQECWHFATKAGRDVIVTLPPSFLRRQGLPRRDLDYGEVDGTSRARAMGNDTVRRHAADDGFEPPEFDRLAPLVKTHEEATRAMQQFECLAHG